MKRFITVLTFLRAILAARASDETLAQGVPGTYSRSLLGMRSEALTLRSDGTYLFTTHFDVGSDEERGVWTVRYSVVILAVKKRGEVFEKKAAHFFILALDAELALRVQDDDSGIQSDDEKEPMLLFRREKNRANKAPEPTTMAVTPRATS